MITGETQLIVHLGYPTKSFKASMIYNPYFDSIGVNAVVVPMGVKSEAYGEVVRTLFQLTNIRGALVTMPHKAATVALMDELSMAAKIAGACNAIRRREDGALIGDMFDGEGFVRGVKRKGRRIAGASALIVGAGGVGSAIAASLAAAGLARLGLYDPNQVASDKLAARLHTHYPALMIELGGAEPRGYEIAVNASPLGMNAGDPLPFDVTRLDPTTFVGEVVMKEEMTPLLRAAQVRGCAFQIGADMLFEQIPAYLEFFGYPATTSDELRAVATIAY
jgi:shikimate dehydrogenase